MFCTRSRRVIMKLLIAGAMLTLSSVPAYADRITIVLFTGFSGSSGTAGLDTLSQTLRGSLPNIDSRVFGHTQGQAALDFVNANQQGRCCLVVIGHSLGGDAVIEFTNNFLNPAGIMVDLTVQIDSVGVGDQILPSTVMRGINYFQISTGLFEPQGAMNVQGAININVEMLFDDNTITHTSIDDDVRLHARIVNDVANKCIPEPATMVLLSTGLAGVGAAVRKRRKVRYSKGV